MFSLIVAVVAIVLVVLTIAIAAYYGGSQVEEGADQAKVAALTNQAQQISAANLFYAADHGGQDAPTFQALVDTGYMSSLPKLWQTVDGYAVTAEEANISDESCEAFNQRQGIHSVPSCSDPAFSDKIVCCTTN